MQLGVHIATFPGPATADLGPMRGRAGDAAEAAGVSNLTFMDHYFQMDAIFAAEEPMLEGYTSLGFLAAATSKVRLGLLVTGASDYHGSGKDNRLGEHTTDPAVLEALLGQVTSGVALVSS